MQSISTALVSVGFLHPTRRNSVHALDTMHLNGVAPRTGLRAIATRILSGSGAPIFIVMSRALLRPNSLACMRLQNHA